MALFSYGQYWRLLKARVRCFQMAKLFSMLSRVEVSDQQEIKVNVVRAGNFLATIKAAGCTLFKVTSSPPSTLFSMS
jgi:hypothetical protein